MNKQIKDLSVLEIKASIFDLSEQVKYCNGMINELYKELQAKLQAEEEGIQKLSSEQKKTK